MARGKSPTRAVISSGRPAFGSNVHAGSSDLKARERPPAGTGHLNAQMHAALFVPA
jgi:hypothetical protein